MKSNDEMYQMFSKQGLMIAYVYLIFALAGYTLYQLLIQHQATPVLTFILSSQAAVWLIATQVIQIRKLGRAGVSSGAWVTLILVSVLLGLMLIMYGLLLLDSVLH